MGWTVFGDDLTSTDLLTANKFCSIQFGRNIILRAIRTWIIVYNNPTFTSLNFHLYSNRLSGAANSPGLLLATSDSRSKAEIITLENGVKEVYFEFDDVPVQGSTIYNLVINGVGYSPVTDVSYLAWMKAFPDPVYSIPGYTPYMINLPFAPYQVYGIGADL